MQNNTINILGINVKKLPTSKALAGESKKVINEESIAFLLGLHRQFNEKRKQLINARATRYAAPTDIGFLQSNFSKEVRNATWKVGNIPNDLKCRHVEITGPPSPTLIPNALKCNASCFMADFEDATSPTWANIVNGHINLFDAVRGQLAYTSPKGKEYSYTKEDLASENRTTLLCRPRGWHLPEKNITYSGEEFSASLTDFGLYTFCNHKQLTESGSGVYFYFPKIEHYEEALLWADVIKYTETTLGMQPGAIKITVLIETLRLFFQLEEILYVLKNNIVALNCGRWDYIFSAIKCLHSLPNNIFPNRNLIDMSVPFMDKYSKLVVNTCHKRGAYAMGGMSANIPTKKNEEANEKMLAIVERRKINEILNGHDGTWVAHPGLVPTVLNVYKKHLGKNNQLEKMHQNFSPTKEELTQKPAGEITLQGLNENILAALLYIESWLSGVGCLAVGGLMEDAATAEISRCQLWQWGHGKIQLPGGKECNIALINSIINKTCEEQKTKHGNTKKHFNQAAKLLKGFTQNKNLRPFITNEMYEHL